MILSDDPTNKKDEQENEATPSNAEESNETPEDKVEESKEEETPVEEPAADVSSDLSSEAEAKEEEAKEEPVAEKIKEAPVADVPSEAKAKEEVKEEPVEEEDLFDLSLKNGHIQINLGSTTHPVFKAGDTITVHYKIKEGDKQRIQQFKGVVLQRKGTGTTETVTIRKVSGGIGVERIIPVASPFIEKIEVHKHGRVRRARIFYLRDRKGKSARIEEKRS